MLRLPRSSAFDNAPIDPYVHSCFGVTLMLIICVVLPRVAVPGVIEPTAIEEIQVTATRRPAEASDVSAALTLISSDEIRGLNLTTDALNAQTGVFLQQTTPGQGATIIRGLKGSQILHIVDGLRMNNAIFRNAPTQYLALVSPGPVDRIEVLRGASASLYGSDAVGGVVQVLSRTPRFDGAETEIRRSLYLSADTAEIGRSAHAALDVGNRTLAGLISVDYLQTGNRRTGSGERISPSGYDAKGARLAILSTPDDSRSWLFDLQYTQQPNTPRIDELVAGFRQTEPSSSEFGFAPNERWFAHGRHARRAGWWEADWNIDVGWQRIVDDRITRNFGSTIRRHESNRSDLFGFAVSASRDTRHGSWIVGGDYYHDRVASARQEQDLSDGQLRVAPSRFPDDSTVSQAAVFANLQRRINDRHGLSTGLRFSAVDIDITETPGSAATSLRLTDFSADLGWIFQVSDRTQLVANVAHGFRAPNIFDMGTLGERPGNRFNVPNPALDSEYVTQFDTGIRGQSDGLKTELIVYWLHYKDRISSVPIGARTADGRDIVQSRNQAEADIWGIEAAATIRIRDDLTLDAIANFARGEEQEKGSAAVPADRIPPLNGRLGLRYALNEAFTIEPYIVFADSQTRLSPRDVRDVRIDPNGTSGWLTANVRASWQPDERWRLAVSFDNLTDKRYRNHGSGIDAVGRNLIVSFEARW